MSAPILLAGSPLAKKDAHSGNWIWSGAAGALVLLDVESTATRPAMVELSTLLDDLPLYPLDDTGWATRTDLARRYNERLPHETRLPDGDLWTALPSGGSQCRGDRNRPSPSARTGHEFKRRKAVLTCRSVTTKRSSSTSEPRRSIAGCVRRRRGSPSRSGHLPSPRSSGLREAHLSRVADFQSGPTLGHRRVHLAPETLHHLVRGNTWGTLDCATRIEVRGTVEPTTTTVASYMAKGHRRANRLITPAVRSHRGRRWSPVSRPPSE